MNISDLELESIIKEVLEKYKTKVTVIGNSFIVEDKVGKKTTHTLPNSRGSTFKSIDKIK